MIVVDANVAVKWFLPEPLSEAADALIDEQHVRIAPEHVLVGAWRAGKISLPDVRSAVSAMSELIQVLPTRDLIEHAVAIAAEIGCSTYDALYVAAAEQNEAALVTADLKLVRQLVAVDRLGHTRILGT